MTAAEPSPPTAPGWLRRAARPVVLSWLDLTVEDGDRVPDDGPVILASNHHSHADVLALGAGIDRPLTFLGSAHLAALPAVGRMLPSLGFVPIERGSADAGALERCLAILAAGGALVVFPEGGRSRDGRVYRPRSGVARLAAAAGCRTVPIGVRGTRAVWPVGGRPRARGAEVGLRIGRPLDPPAQTPRDRRRWSEHLHRRLVELSDGEAAAEMLGRDVA